MLYLIGGAPRCGKTKLAKRFSLELGVPVLSTDELRKDAVRSAPADEVSAKFPFEAMFDGDQVDRCFELYSPQDFLSADKREARTLLSMIRSFLREKSISGEDYIVEGVHLLPKYLAGLRLPKKEYRVVYLAKTDEELILEGLKRNRDKKDWILGHIHKKETLSRAASMVKLYGKYFSVEAKKFGFKFINTEEGFFQKIDDACWYLMGGKER